jgi:hypothetical protein
MKIATVLNSHENSNVFHDTLDSILTWISNDVLVLVDGANWDQFSKQELPVYKIEGLRHECANSPYRNVALGLKSAWDIWQDNVDWYCYTEYDCLFGSSEIVRDLFSADKFGIWCVGNDHRVSDIKFPLLEVMLKTQINQSHYLLGCCVFYKNTFIKKLAEIDFFERFLYLTNTFSQGFFPNYNKHDISEHLYPTLAVHFGGKIGQLADWSEKEQKWTGNPKYPVRFRPDLEQGWQDACIMHPLKEYDNPVRQYHRKKRNG